MAVVGVVACLTGCAAGVNPIAVTYESCNLEDQSEYAVLGDDATSLTIDGEGDESWGIRPGTFDCVLEALDVPDSVTAQMGATRALDGMQDAAWSDMRATWTYHPDDGLDVIFTYNDE